MKFCASIKYNRHGELSREAQCVDFLLDLSTEIDNELTMVEHGDDLIVSFEITSNSVFDADRYLKHVAKKLYSMFGEWDQMEMYQ